jgi:hypothetical protein
MKEDPPETKAELLLHLSNEVSRIAGSLAQLSIGAGTLPPRTSPFCNQNEFDVPPERVDWLIKARRGRADYLTRQLFSDPAWDILLELLRAEIAQERVSASNACIAASVPTSTGLRWLRALEHHGLSFGKAISTIRGVLSPLSRMRRAWRSAATSSKSSDRHHPSDGRFARPGFPQQVPAASAWTISTEMAAQRFVAGTFGREV